MLGFVHQHINGADTLATVLDCKAVKAIVQLGNAATESRPVVQIRVGRLLFKHDGLWRLPLPARP